MRQTPTDGNLTAEEFQRWYSQPLGNGSALLVWNTEAEATSKMSLGQLHQQTNLSAYPPTEVFGRFAEVTGENSHISQADFKDCFGELAVEREVPLSGDEEDQYRIALSRLNRVFGVDGNGEIDFTELNSGRSVLCGNMQDEKAAAAFALYNYNGDGMSTLEEMTRFLTSIFKVVSCTTPSRARSSEWTVAIPKSWLKSRRRRPLEWPTSIMMATSPSRSSRRGTRTRFWVAVQTQTQTQWK